MKNTFRNWLKIFFLVPLLWLGITHSSFAEESTPLHTEGYRADADDWYNLYYGENLYVRVDETDVDPLTADHQWIRLSMSPEKTFHVSVVYLSETHEYEITVGDFDETVSTLNLTIEDPNTHAVEKTLSLYSGSVIRLRTAMMEAVYHDGGTDGDSAWEEIRLNPLNETGVRYDFEQSGDFLISVQKKLHFDNSVNPGPFKGEGEEPVSPPADDHPIDISGSGTPSTSPENPTPSPSTSNSIDDGMMLGGGGGLLSCSLSMENSDSFPGLDLFAFGMVGLLGSAYLFRKGKAE